MNGSGSIGAVNVMKVEKLYRIFTVMLIGSLKNLSCYDRT